MCAGIDCFLKGTGIVGRSIAGGTEVLDGEKRGLRCRFGPDVLRIRQRREYENGDSYSETHRAECKPHETRNGVRPNDPRAIANHSLIAKDSARVRQAEYWQSHFDRANNSHFVCRIALTGNGFLFIAFFPESARVSLLW